MSTTYGPQALRMPRTRQSTLMLAAFLAGALLATTATLALLTSASAPATAERSRTTLTFERLAGRGEMEFPGLEARGRPASGAGPHRLLTPRGGLAEYPGLEMPRPPLGQARGGLQQYAGTR